MPPAARFPASPVLLAVLAQRKKLAQVHGVNTRNALLLFIRCGRVVVVRFLGGAVVRLVAKRALLDSLVVLPKRRGGFVPRQGGLTCGKGVYLRVVLDAACHGVSLLEGTVRGALPGRSRVYGRMGPGGWLSIPPALLEAVASTVRGKQTVCESRVNGERVSCIHLCNPF